MCARKALKVSALDRIYRIQDHVSQRMFDKEFHYDCNLYQHLTPPVTLLLFVSSPLLLLIFISPSHSVLLHFELLNVLSPTHIYTLFSTISSEGNEEEENEEEEKKQGIPVVSLCLSSAQDSDEVEEDDDVAALLTSYPRELRNSHKSC